jgi:predicted Zn-dependent peptidase
MILFLSAVAAAGDPTLPSTRYQLDNGLKVTLSPDDSVPFVCVNVWYDVGSKDEVAGRSGFAHLFEHLMFNGSQHADDDFFAPLQPLGARLNGSTTLDRTNYYECLPSEHLPLALFLEADRMGWLLPALTTEKLQNQKDVVRNERRQNYDNPPYGQAWLEILRNSYPEGHPYHIATIGKHEEIEAATLDDVSAFFRKWYLPNNASLVLTGAYDEAVARELIARYFGPVPRGPQPEHARPPAATFTEERRVRATDDVPFEKVWLVWHSPALYAPGDAELDLLSGALASGKESRLYRTLVHDQQIAQDVSAFQSSSAWESLYVITAQASAGHTGEELVRAIDAELAAARGPKPITAAEIEVEKTAYEVQFFGSLTSIQGKADLLNGYITRTGDAEYLGKDLARYREASVEGVNRALADWLPADRRLVLTIGPEVK